MRGPCASKTMCYDGWAGRPGPSGALKLSWSEIQCTVQEQVRYNMICHGTIGIVENMGVTPVSRLEVIVTSRCLPHHSKTSLNQMLLPTNKFYSSHGTSSTIIAHDVFTSITSHNIFMPFPRQNHERQIPLSSPETVADQRSAHVLHPPSLLISYFELCISMQSSIPQRSVNVPA